MKSAIQENRVENSQIGGTVMSTAFQLNIDSHGVARLVFDLPGEKVNKFTVEVMEELEQVLDTLHNNKSVKLLVITSGKDEVFVAGADLHKFEPAFQNRPTLEAIIRTGHRVFNKLEALPFPSVAVIRGACLGGGMEFALACTFRVVADHPKTLLGLPETTLGIIPGWGGTQRMIHLVGLINGLPLILTGKGIKADKAYKMKLADAIVPWEFQETKVAEFIKQVLTSEGRKHILSRRKRNGLGNFLLEGNPIGRYFIFRKALQDVLSKTKGQYPAPLAALELVKSTCTMSLKQGLEKEISTILGFDNKSFEIASNLINIFFISEALKKDTGVPAGVVPAKVQSTGIVGAGTMGGGIAWLLSYNGFSVRMKDINWDAIGKGYGAAYAIYSKFVKDRRLKKTDASLRFQRISGTIDYSGFQNADIVFEAAVENIELKHKILTELEAKVRTDTIIATNTSSLTIKEMSKVMKHPERFVGMHFFNPPNKMPLVEVVAGEKSSPEAIATAVALCKKLGKTAMVVGDCPGFLVNRVFVLGANEVMFMLEEGASMESLEKMMLSFGMPMSPFILSDEVGNDVGYKVAKMFEQSYGVRMKAPKISELMYENKLFGKKVGKGFYVYHGEKKQVNPQVKDLLKTINTPKRELSEADMIDRVILSMINEASRCLQEKVVKKAEYLDMALIMGIGFPPFRGGLLKYADKIGINTVVDRLRHFEKLYGARFAPSEHLLAMQKQGQSFYNK